MGVADDGDFKWVTSLPQIILAALFSSYVTGDTTRVSIDETEEARLAGVMFGVVNEYCVIPEPLPLPPVEVDSEKDTSIAPGNAAAASSLTVERCTAALGLPPPPCRPDKSKVGHRREPTASPSASLPVSIVRRSFWNGAALRFPSS